MSTSDWADEAVRKLIRASLRNIAAEFLLLAGNLK